MTRLHLNREDLDVYAAIKDHLESSIDERLDQWAYGGTHIDPEDVFLGLIQGGDFSLGRQKHISHRRTNIRPSKLDLCTTFEQTSVYGRDESGFVL